MTLCDRCGKVFAPQKQTMDPNSIVPPGVVCPYCGNYRPMDLNAPTDPPRKPKDKSAKNSCGNPFYKENPYVV